MRHLLSALTVAMAASNAFAQDSSVRVFGGLGNEISLSPVEVYRTLGDRVVSGRDAIGNNARRWNQIDPRLPSSLIAEFDPQGLSPDAILRTIRAGCNTATQNSPVCGRVGIRRDLSLVGQPTVEQSTQQTVSMAPVTEGMTSVTGGMAPITGAITGGMDPVMSGSSSTAGIVTTELPPPPPAPVSNRVQAVPAMVAAAPEPMAVMTSEPVFATRQFAMREDYPPANFAAYGIVAFSAQATSGEEGRYKTICEAYFSTLIDSGSSGAAVESQMVTVWPIINDHPDGLIDRLNTQVREDGMCADAVKYYDLTIARIALRHAEMAGVEMSGPGPFLLAWAPGTKKGRKDTAVLVADLSDVRSESDAREAMRIWREDIEGDPAFWTTGFSALKLRAKLRQLVNRYGNDLMKFVGAS